jgi:hypothetical protein
MPDSNSIVGLNKIARQCRELLTWILIGVRRMNPNDTEDIDIQSIKDRLNDVINDIREIDSIQEIAKLRFIKNRNQEKRKNIVEVPLPKSINISEEYMEDYNNIVEISSSLRRKIEDILDKVLSEHSTYYFQKLGIGGASIQSLRNPELRSKMNIDTLLRLLERILSKI